MIDNIIYTLSSVTMSLYFRSFGYQMVHDHLLFQEYRSCRCSLNKWFQAILVFEIITTIFLIYDGSTVTIAMLGARMWISNATIDPYLGQLYHATNTQAVHGVGTWRKYQNLFMQGNFKDTDCQLHYLNIFRRKLTQSRHVTYSMLNVKVVESQATLKKIVRTWKYLSL